MRPEDERRQQLLTLELFECWTAGLPSDMKDAVMVFEAPGVLVQGSHLSRRLGSDLRRSWEGRAGRMFAAEPWLRFVIVSECPLAESYLRPSQGLSPFARRHFRSQLVRSVVPVGVQPEVEAELIELTRRAAAAVSVAPSGFGGRARQHWC